MDLQDLQIALFDAYKKARQNKRNTLNQLKFEANLESHIFSLARELQNRTYEVSPSLCFVSQKPVAREIIAADFRDRVVHHLLYNWLYPIFDRQFIYDSYSCRVGKGTLFGINRVRGFCRAASDDFRKECYVLRLDISGFFMNINRDILYRLILEGLAKANYKNIPDVDLAKFLIRKFVYNDPLKQAKFRGRPSDWNILPQNKSLKYAPLNCGLPIGNLTSQLFGNIYMNPLDHFIKRHLKMHYYGRYVDDMVFVSPEKSQLKGVLENVKKFAFQELKIQVHPHKIYLQSVFKGFPFLGAFVLPWRIYPSHRSVKFFKECLENACHTFHQIQSYKGYFGHFNFFLRMRLCL